MYDEAELREETAVRNSDDISSTRDIDAFRIAIATSEGLRIDQHFGHANEFTIYDVDAGGARRLERRVVAEHSVGDEDKRETIYRMIADCRMLLVAKIGATPQEALAARGIEASDMWAGEPVEAALAAVFGAKSVAASDEPIDAAEFRLLHAMLRVTDIDRSVDFYTRLLGMSVLERREHKKNQFTQVYLGYAPGLAGMALELVFNWQRETPYVAGESFGHVAIAVTSIMKLCDRLAAEGVAMPRPPRAQRHGESIVAFVEDPDGHRIELVQSPDPA